MDGFRRWALTVGALAAAAFAIVSLPGSAPVTPATRTAGMLAVTPIPAGDALSAPAQSALDRVLGQDHSVVAASAVYGSGSSKVALVYDPNHIAVLSQADVATGGYSSSAHQNGVSRAVITTTRPAGQIQRMAVSVIVDSTVKPAPKVALLRRTVAAAMGLQRKRGDTLTITRMPFAATASGAAATANISLLGVSDPARYLATALGTAAALMLLAGLGLDMVRRKPAPVSARP